MNEQVTEIVNQPGMPDILQWKDDVEKERKLGLIKRTVAKDATNDELAMFIYQAKKTGLDPLARQIYFVKRNRNVFDRKTNKWHTEAVVTIQTGIDGYRSVAGRSRDLSGIDDPVFDSEDGEHPGKATVTVWRIDRNGNRQAYTASARWDEYCPMGKDGKPMAQWAKMPYLMLGKCAEALALRKAFPQDLSGIYTTEEMQQADAPQQEAKVVPEKVIEAEVVPEITDDEMNPFTEEQHEQTKQ